MISVILNLDPGVILLPEDGPGYLQLSLLSVIRFRRRCFVEIHHVRPYERVIVIAHIPHLSKCVGKGEGNNGEVNCPFAWADSGWTCLEPLDESEAVMKRCVGGSDGCQRTREQRILVGNRNARQRDR